uniref:Uncharacterized protein n=1 Tax=Caudovirales sp. ctkvU4 TaxID=2826783 RepID=A0A8S5QR21_9CAUD|nr:MAG TPA: hypothetical protein [Caudovirales sp. ctkvU4]
MIIAGKGARREVEKIKGPPGSCKGKPSLLIYRDRKDDHGK